MNVLVTGGAGYIGSHVAKALAQAGHEAVSYDNLSRGHARAVRWGPLVQGDLGDAARLETAIARHRIEAVVHLAAYAYVGESMEAPELYFDNNVARSMVLLDVCRRTDVKSLIFSSSCATYGPPEIVPLSEDHPQRPVSPYGESKLMVERMLRWHGEIHGLRWMALRYFNAAGADPDGEIGEAHHPETHLIPLVIEAALDRSRPVRVFGTDYDTEDGTAIRDYIHVSDLARAHVQALSYLDAGGPSEAVNLGTGRGYSVKQVLSAVEDVAGRAPAVEEAPRRAGDPAALWAKTERARQLLGWVPDYFELSEIVQHAYQWRIGAGRLAEAARA